MQCVQGAKSRTIRILQIHNIYQGKTGEETVVEEERAILEKQGHVVIQFIKDNSVIEKTSLIDKARLLLNLRKSDAVIEEIKAVIIKGKPDICHVHNTFPLISPAVYQLCQEMRVPVVKTLHNYKLVCTNSLMFRNGEVCDLCLNKSLYNSIKYKCYRNSYAATAAQADVIQHHRNLGTWKDKVDRYFALTHFQKDLIVDANGLSEEKVVVKPNFISEPNSDVSRENFYLFLGRVHDYKGLQDLLYLFKENTKDNFVVIGRADNPDIFDQFSQVVYLGEQDREVALDYMRRCKAVIFPSKYYEGMPMVILEAFSHKKAVISRNRGAMSEMIIDQYNGLHYNSESELVDAINLLEGDKFLLDQLGQKAFEDYQKKYSVETGYFNLINEYQDVISNYGSKDKRT